MDFNWRDILLIVGGGGVLGKLVQEYGGVAINSIASWFNPEQRRLVEQQRRQQDLDASQQATQFWHDTLEAQNQEIAAIRQEFSEYRKATRADIAAMEERHSREIAALKVSYEEKLEEERGHRQELETEVKALRVKVAQLERERDDLREKLEATSQNGAGDA